MKIEVRKADRTDLCALSKFALENDCIFGKDLTDKFDEVLCQTGHSVLLCFAEDVLCGVMSVTFVEGLTKKFPIAVFCGGKTKKGESESIIRAALVSKGEELSKAHGCKRIYC